MKKIGIAGCGGIGSNIAVNLVRSGISTLKLVDFDRIEKSNLNRQFFFSDQLSEYKVHALRDNLLRINPELKIEMNCLKLNEKNLYQEFENYDIIIEGFDVKESKKNLLEVFAQTEKIVVSACGIAGFNTENVLIKTIGNAFIVGDFRTDSQTGKLFFHKIQYITSLMSEIVLKQCGYGNE